MADRPNRTQRAAEMAERRAEMFRLYTRDRLTQAEIAARYGITQQAVSEQIRKAIAERPAHAVDEHRVIELAKLDEAERSVMQVLQREHLTVSGGKVVEVWDPDRGEEVPLVDDAPILKAIDRLMSIAKHRADLLGLKAPTKVSVEAEQLSAEIAALIATVISPAGADDDDAGP